MAREGRDAVFLPQKQPSLGSLASRSQTNNPSKNDRILPSRTWNMKKLHETEKQNQNYPSHGLAPHEQQESSRDLWAVHHDWAACGLAFTLTSLCRFLLTS